MTGAPGVSVLFPVRDAEPHLAEAIASISEQAYTDFEVVAVDDGSADGSAEALDAWAARDPRVRVVHQNPSGIVPALEVARSLARAPYLARMDADDVADPDRLGRQLALMEADPTLSACGCGVRYFPRAVVRDGARRYERWLNAVVTPEEIAAAVFVECPLAHPTLFLRADALDEVGGYVDRGWPEDYDLVLRLWAAGHRLGKVPDVLHGWREGEDRLSRRHPRYAPRSFRACKVHYLGRTLLRGGRPAVLWGAGPVGKSFARALRKAGTPVRAFVDLDPRKIGQEIHGAPVLHPDDALALPRGPLHLAAVGQKGARKRILELLHGAGLSTPNEAVAVA